MQIKGRDLWKIHIWSFIRKHPNLAKILTNLKKMGIRLAGCIDEVRWKYRYNALDV